MFYYAAFISRNHALLMEQRLKNEGIVSELTYMPRVIMSDLCNLGLKFNEIDLKRAANIINRAGLPGYKIYKEVLYPRDAQYNEVDLSTVV